MVIKKRQIADGFKQVSVAKERPSGKLKRNQQDERAASRSGTGVEIRADGHAPGKRQRSSPPQVTIQAEPVVPSMGGRFSKRERLEDSSLAAQSFLKSLVMPAPSLEPAVVEGDRIEVARVMEDMIAALEQQVFSNHPPKIVEHHASTRAVTDSDQRTPRESCVNVKMEEPSTDVITSSIRSVSLVNTPTPHSHREQQPRQAAPIVSEPQRSGKAMLRRRRQSVDDSDSSGEDGHDSGGNRRKRSNTTVTPPPPPSSAPLVLKVAEPKVKVQSPVWHTVKSGNRRGKHSLDSARKQCKRLSSDDDREEGHYRASKQQITRTAHYPSVNPQGAEGDSSIDALSDAFGSLAQTRLFFVSTRKVRNGSSSCSCCR